MQLDHYFSPVSTDNILYWKWIERLWIQGPQVKGKSGCDACWKRRLKVKVYTLNNKITPFFFFFFFLFRASTAAHGSSQGRGRIGAAGAMLNHTHSKKRSEVHLGPTHSSQKHQILNPLSEARDWNCTLMDISQASQPAEPHQELPRPHHFPTQPHLIPSSFFSKLKYSWLTIPC